MDLVNSEHYTLFAVEFSYISNSLWHSSEGYVSVSNIKLLLSSV